MAPDFGSPVANTINADPSKGLNTISDLMRLKSQNLGIQAQQAQLPAIQGEAQVRTQKAQQMQAFGAMLQSGVDDQGNSLRGADGDLDPAKVTMAAGRVAPLAPEIAQNIIKTHSDKVALQSSALTLDANQRRMIAGPMQALTLDPSDENIGNVRDSIGLMAKQHPEMIGLASHAGSLLDTVSKVQDPAKRTEMANKFSAIFQPPNPVGTQPEAATVDNGPYISQGAVAPAAAGGGFTPATNVLKGLPPTATTVGRGGQPQYLGKYPDRGGPIVAGATPGQTELASGGAQDINQHYAAVQSEAQRAETFTGIARNVQEFAHKALTGTATDRLQLMNGMLAYIDPTLHAENVKTASDLLQKNMAQLNLQGNASTDFKQMVTQMAQPHMDMSEEAIGKAASQLIGQVQMKKSIGTYLTGPYNHSQLTGDQTLYRAQRDAVSNIADARIWEFASLPKTERAAFAREHPDLLPKLQKAEALGLVKE